MLNNDVTFFDSFGVEHIPREIRRFIGNKNMQTDIFRIQAYDSVMYGYFCIGFIDYMLAGKTLIDYASLFSPPDFIKKGYNNFRLDKKWGRAEGEAPSTYPNLSKIEENTQNLGFFHCGNS